MMCQPGPAAAVHARWPHIAELAGVHMWYTYTCMTYVYQPTNMGFQLTAPGFAKRLDVLNKTWLLLKTNVVFGKINDSWNSWNSSWHYRNRIKLMVDIIVGEIVLKPPSKCCRSARRPGCLRSGGRPATPAIIIIITIIIINIMSIIIIIRLINNYHYYCCYGYYYHCYYHQ